MFATEREAKNHFGEDVDVEACERCGQWTASRADHDDGDIIGPCCADEGAWNVYDRICDQCDAEVTDEEIDAARNERIPI
jgi:hypothetical protein